jgi:DNA-binding transcriptional LysR family regulator
MNWGGFDLNLLAVFEAVMQERNLTRAGNRLGLSQPAVSHALARLRHRLKDDLLIRGPDGMASTPRAEQLVGPVREALAGLQIALEPQAARPEDMSGHCTIAANGYTAFALTDRLVNMLLSAAPRLKLTILPSGTRNVLDELDAGVIDLALTRMLDSGDRFKCTGVMTDHFVAAMRSGHPAAASELSLKDIAELGHLTITSTGDNTSFLDEALEERQMKRSIALSLPFLSVPDVLAKSDLIAVLPARIAAKLGRTYEIVARPLPCKSPAVDLAMTWHRRLDAQPEQRWIRDKVRRCLAKINREG